MARYAVELNDTLSATLTLGSVVADTGGTARRLKFYQFIFGSEAIPADVGILWAADRITDDGTGTAVTPSPIDPADAAALGEAKENHSVEPTYTAGPLRMLAVACTQRGGFTWTAAPGREIVTPATADNGLGFRTPTLNGGTPVATLYVAFEEQ